MAGRRAYRRGMATYTHGHHESVLRSHRWRTASNSAAYLLPHLRPGMSLLDVGAGPGTITADLAHLVDPRDRAGARRKRAGTSPVPVAGHAKNVDFVVGDVHALDFPDDTFDVVHAHQVLQHVADPVKALTEMAPGHQAGRHRRGTRQRLRRVHLVSGSCPSWTSGWRSTSGWPATNGGEPDAGRRLLSWAQAAGLDRGHADARSTWLFATAEDRAWWGGMWADRIVDSDIARAAIDSGEATADRSVPDQPGLARVGRPAPDGWFVILHGELICRV